MFPPLAGVAVNVTLVPEQIELSASLEVMETDGVNPDETEVVIELLVAVADVWHALLAVMTTDTAPLFGKLELV